jgi:hypothetical protein
MTVLIARTGASRASGVRCNHVAPLGSLTLFARLACVSMTSFKSVAYYPLSQYLPCASMIFIALTSVQLTTIDLAILSLLLQQVVQHLLSAEQSRLNTGLYS